MSPQYESKPRPRTKAATSSRNRASGRSAAASRASCSAAADAKLLDTVADVPLFVVAAVSRRKNGELLELSRTVWVGGRVRFRFVQHSAD